MPFLRFENLLDADDLAVIRQALAARADHMTPSTVTDSATLAATYDASHRESETARDLDDIWPLFESRLTALLPHVRRELDIPHFPLGTIERQLTRHRDGGFFGPHRDDNLPGTDGARMVTFVFYVHAEPKAFEGGELRLFAPGSNVADRHEQPWVDLEPTSNSIVFFASDHLHEVRPVRATGSGPGAERWTVNGWFRAGDMGRPRVPRVSPGVRNLLARRYVPEIGGEAFAMRPSPATARDALMARWTAARPGTLGSPEATSSPHTAGSENAPANDAEAEAEADEKASDTMDSGAAAVPAPNSAATPTFIDLGELGNELLEDLRPLHETWAGVELEPIGTYGLRLHRADDSVPLHVEHTNTHVVCSMLVVDQDGGAPWPFELHTADRRHRLHVTPGQIVLYQGAVHPHGHPTALAGQHHVSLLLHYRPVGWAEQAHDMVRQGLDDGLIDHDGALIDTSILR